MVLAAVCCRPVIRTTSIAPEPSFANADVLIVGTPFDFRMGYGNVART
jgi:hypothetical protein